MLKGIRRCVSVALLLNLLPAAQGRAEDCGTSLDCYRRNQRLLLGDGEIDPKALSSSLDDLRFYYRNVAPVQVEVRKGTSESLTKAIFREHFDLLRVQVASERKYVNQDLDRGLIRRKSSHQSSERFRKRARDLAFESWARTVEYALLTLQLKSAFAEKARGPAMITGASVSIDGDGQKAALGPVAPAAVSGDEIWANTAQVAKRLSFLAGPRVGYEAEVAAVRAARAARLADAGKTSGRKRLGALELGAGPVEKSALSDQLQLPVDAAESAIRSLPEDIEEAIGRILGDSNKKVEEENRLSAAYVKPSGAKGELVPMSNVWAPQLKEVFKAEFSKLKKRYKDLYGKVRSVLESVDLSAQAIANKVDLEAAGAGRKSLGGGETVESLSASLSNLSDEALVSKLDSFFKQQLARLRAKVGNGTATQDELDALGKFESLKDIADFFKGLRADFTKQPRWGIQFGISSDDFTSNDGLRSGRAKLYGFGYTLNSNFRLSVGMSRFGGESDFYYGLTFGGAGLARLLGLGN